MSADETPPALERPYLLLTPIPFKRDAQGRIWLDRLWHHDFVEHLRYLKRVILAAPRERGELDGKELVEVVLPDGVELELVELPPMRSTIGAALQLPSTARRLWGAIGRSEIVHSGVVGWPYPLGWVANPMALLRRRKLVIVVESATWRVTADDPPLKDRVRAQVSEVLARFFATRADLRLFTQREYERSLAPRAHGPSYITPATWVNAADIRSADQAADDWKAKAQPVRLLCPTRLVEAKGVRVLLDAVKRLPADAQIAVDIMGKGPLAAECERAAEAEPRLSIRPTTDYGEPFFSAVREYHAVLVPSLGDEQPRILFDAFAQAVPVIASATDGMRPHVEDGATGWLLEPGDAEALSAALTRAASSPDELEAMGMAALAGAHRYTHRGMHEQRWRILHERFGRARG